MPKPSPMTDDETTKVQKLLSDVQELIEKGEYEAGVVVNVLLNIAARYAAATKWPLRNFKKVAEAVYKQQKSNVSDLERAKRAAEDEHAQA